ncbi:hypothetical protein FXO37_11111 [Capsicum annuum]|nr:hypothetical protein FXO37_11111 [Capsicum annuum]
MENRLKELSMEDSDEEPPLAVKINGAVNSNQLTETSEIPPVGVTVITGYLGSGKSTVNFYFSTLFYWPFSRDKAPPIEIINNEDVQIYLNDINGEGEYVLPCQVERKVPRDREDVLPSRVEKEVPCDNADVLLCQVEKDIPVDNEDVLPCQVKKDVPRGNEADVQLPE